MLATHTPLLPAKTRGPHTSVSNMGAVFVNQLYECQERKEVDIMSLNMNNSLFPAQPFIELVHVNTNCQDCFYGEQARFFFGNRKCNWLYNS